VAITSTTLNMRPAEISHKLRMRIVQCKSLLYAATIAFSLKYGIKINIPS